MKMKRGRKEKERLEIMINKTREVESMISNLTLPNPTDVSEEKVK